MWTNPPKESSESLTASNRKEAYFTTVVVRFCSRSFPSLISEIIRSGMLTIIKHTTRHHLPRGVPWLLYSSKCDAITSIRHSSPSTSMHDSTGTVYLFNCSDSINTVTEQNTWSMRNVACHGSLVHEVTL